MASGAFGSNDSMDGNPASGPLDGRLESWKEIAAYLNRTVRTARRWEESEGLPVHRHEHERQSTVYAYRAELDAWLATRQPTLDETGPPLEAAPSAAAPSSPTPSSATTIAAAVPTGFFIPRWLAVSTAAAGVGLLLFIMYGVVFANWRFMIVL